MANKRKKIAVDVCTWVDDEKGALKMEVALPGVKKDDISLKMLDYSFNLKAPRDEFDFVSAGSFCCPVSPEAADANYENGLLKVAVPFKDPMDGAIEVGIH